MLGWDEHGRVVRGCDVGVPGLGALRPDGAVEISAIKAGNRVRAVAATVLEDMRPMVIALVVGLQSATSAPIITVRLLGSPKWLIGLDALRAMAMNSCLRQRCIPGSSVGVIVIRETK